MIKMQKYIMAGATLILLSLLLIGCGKDDDQLSDQEKAEQFGKMMEPKMEERIHAEDYNSFVKSIHFNKAKIDPLGGITVDGYVNDTTDYDFTFFLNHQDKNDVSSFGFSDELAKKMGNFDKSEPAPLPSKESTFNEKYPGTSLRNLHQSSNE